MATAEVDERAIPRFDQEEKRGVDSPYVVILYNDDYHTLDEVVHQLLLATGYSVERCVRIMLEAHTTGRAVAYSGTESECERVAKILRRIRLQVETDRS